MSKITSTFITNSDTVLCAKIDLTSSKLWMRQKLCVCAQACVSTHRCTACSIKDAHI
jgi:hypothetical protein